MLSKTLDLSERRFHLPARRSFASVAALLVLAAMACGSAATATPELMPGSKPLAGGPLAEGDIQPILSTTVLRVGTQRVAFLLTTAKALVKEPQANVTSVYLGDGEAITETKIARFHLWPYGTRGSYSTEMTFDRSGPWRLDIMVDREAGPAGTQVAIDVAEKVPVPEIGAIPPLSPSKTVHTVSRLEELTSDYTPDPDLYQITIAEAAISGRPSVIVFSTPAFCTNPTCGPQADTLSELKESHKGQANFIHVELYDNPAEIQGDLSRARYTNLVHVWGLSALPHWFNESWTFVLGADGRIAQRFEAFASLEELEEALRAVLGPT